MDVSGFYLRGLLHGIAAYMRKHGNWSVYLPERGRDDFPVEWLRKWNGHGIIACIHRAGIAPPLKRLRMPIVDVSSDRLIPSAPWVETDDAAIARCAAEHLLERGLKQFAFCGDNRHNWSILREKQFCASIQNAGHACRTYHPRSRWELTGEAELEHLAAWLAGNDANLAVTRT